MNQTIKEKIMPLVIGGGCSVGLFASLAGVAYISTKNGESHYNQRDKSYVVRQDLLDNKFRYRKGTSINAFENPQVTLRDENNDGCKEAYLNIKGKWYSLKYNEQAEPYFIESKEMMQRVEKGLEIR